MDIQIQSRNIKGRVQTSTRAKTKHLTSSEYVEAVHAAQIQEQHESFLSKTFRLPMLGISTDYLSLIGEKEDILDSKQQFFFQFVVVRIWW
jgi:hypothetical protein